MARSAQPLVPLPWERVLWCGRPAGRAVSRVRYFLTDFRLVRLDGRRLTELALLDILEIQQRRSRLERLTRTSTLVVRSRRRSEQLAFEHIRDGAQLAAVLELLAGEPQARLDLGAVAAALKWHPPTFRGGAGPRTPLVRNLAVVSVACSSIFGVAIALHGTPAPAAYAPDDPVYPSGHKRSQADIVQFMQRQVMPWARVTLAPIKGGVDRVTCETCHGRNAEARGWRMPAVAALPEPDLRQSGWEHWGGTMDAQMRNAIYGYRAESDNQARAGYMREMVMPGMARLLNRPAYDFTKPYEYNRSRSAFGCYHCHLVQ